MTGFPFQNETLRYRVIWPGGGSLGDVTLTAHKAGDGGWDFDMSTSVAIPVVPISDNYKSSAFGTDLCSSTLQREISHGNKKVIEKTEFDQKNNQAHRQTMVPAGGGKSEFAHSHLRARCADVPIPGAARNGTGTGCRPRARYFSARATT